MQNCFKKDEIQTFNYSDLNEKILVIKVVDNEEVLVVSGVDVNTGKIYILLSELKQCI